MGNWDQIVNVASKLGVVSLLTLILVGGYMGIWVFGTTYKDMAAERDEWKQLALRGTKLAAVAANSSIRGVRDPIPANPLLRGISPPEVRTVLDQVEQRVKPLSEPDSEPEAR